MQFKWSDTTKSKVYEDALSIRTKVFVDEQNVDASLEIDDYEDYCDYVVGYVNDTPVATARLYDAKEYGKVQRVAVMSSFRGQNIGYRLMEEVERFAKQNGFSMLKLGAQNHAIPFYEKLGYTVCSQEYVDADILHHDINKMIKANCKLVRRFL